MLCWRDIDEGLHEKRKTLESLFLNFIGSIYKLG
jgi:hypothetical protein